MTTTKDKDEVEVQKFFLWIKKTILRVKTEGNPIYLIRYSLLTTPWFAVKLHRILMSDDECLHDHPWSFISIILWGGYHEITQTVINLGRLKPLKVLVREHYGPGSILWRPSPWPHRLEVTKPATTIVITFKRTRDWGFYTANGWVFWEKFVRSGRGCE